MSTVQFETRGPVAYIRLDRPEMNPFNAQMFVDLNAAVDRFQADDTLRVAIVGGTGKRAFSAGIDLKDLGHSLSGDELPKTPKLIHMAQPGYLDKPVIAAIRGYCVGEGLHLALACDFRVCASDAIFAAPEVAVGIPLIRLASQAVQTIGLPAAIELCYLGEKKDAAWALAHQLVHRVVLPGEEIAEAEKIAKRLCEVSFPALRATKRTVWKSLEMSYDEVFAFGLPLREQVMASGDAKRASSAFVESRTTR